MNYWDGNFFLAGANSYYLQVFNGTFNWFIGGGPVLSSQGIWRQVEAVFSFGLYTWVIYGGTLFRVVHPGFRGGQYELTTLGLSNEWTGASCLVFLR